MEMLCICCWAAHFLSEENEKQWNWCVVRWLGCSWSCLSSGWRGIITSKIAASTQCSSQGICSLCGSNDSQSESMLSSCCGMMRNNANAFGNCVPECCVSISLITQVTKEFSHPKSKCRFSCGAEKGLVGLYQNGCIEQIYREGHKQGKLRQHYMYGASPRPCSPTSSAANPFTLAAFCRLRLLIDWLIVRFGSHFLNSQSWPSIIVCPAGKALAMLGTIFLSLTLSWTLSSHTESVLWCDINCDNFATYLTHIHVLRWTNNIDIFDEEKTK